MRLTCLRCGHQFDLGIQHGSAAITCVCGLEHEYPRVVDTGVAPNLRAAERSRHKAFRAAGLVRNVGGFALGIAALGALFFPLGLIGALVGIYTLTMIRGPIGRYSGRRHALLAIALGVTVFVAEGALALSWYDARQTRKRVAIQASASEDLRVLLRAQRLFFANHERYGTKSELKYEPHYANYTIYLGDDEAYQSRTGIDAPLTPSFPAGVGTDAFTAVAIANLDGDADLDVWVLYDTGEVVHAADDLSAAPGAILDPTKSAE